MFEKTLKIFLGLLIISVITIAYLLSDFNPIYKNEEFTELIAKIKKAQKEDFKSFTDIHDKIYQKTKEPNCPCQNVSNTIRYSRHGYSLTKLLYELKIKKEFNQNECFKYILANYDFGYHNIGIKVASNFYFNKDVKNLNEMEKIMLIAMLKNSSLYNPIRNPEGLKNRILMLKIILNKQNKQD